MLPETDYVADLMGRSLPCVKRGKPERKLLAGAQIAPIPRKTNTSRLSGSLGSTKRVAIQLEGEDC